MTFMNKLLIDFRKMRGLRDSIAFLKFYNGHIMTSAYVQIDGQK